MCVLHVATWADMYVCCRMLVIFFLRPYTKTYFRVLEDCPKLRSAHSTSTAHSASSTQTLTRKKVGPYLTSGHKKTLYSPYDSRIGYLQPMSCTILFLRRNLAYGNSCMKKKNPQILLKSVIFFFCSLTQKCCHTTNSTETFSQPINYL